MLQQFPVIVGPTAGGKSQLAMALALHLETMGHGPAELISMDSMQVYRGMDIGTAKPTANERSQVVHHLIDVVNPDEAFTVDRWLALAEAAMRDIRERGGTPIVVGGTHLYAKSLLEGLFKGPEPDAELRAELSALPAVQLRTELERIDPESAARIHPNDQRRMIRAIEVFRQTGTPISQLQQQWDTGRSRPDAVLVALEWAAAQINPRINARVRTMIGDGLLEEVRGLAEKMGPQARSALGYKQLLEHLDGGCSLEEAAEKIKIETRRFAKNQRTWLRRLSADGKTIRLDAGATAPEKWPQLVVNTLVRAI